MSRFEAWKKWQHALKHWLNAKSWTYDNNMKRVPINQSEVVFWGELAGKYERIHSEALNNERT
jgi:hypothetical protein